GQGRARRGGRPGGAALAAGDITPLREQADRLGAALEAARRDLAAAQQRAEQAAATVATAQAEHDAARAAAARLEQDLVAAHAAAHEGAERYAAAQARAERAERQVDQLLAALAAARTPDPGQPDTGQARPDPRERP